MASVTQSEPLTTHPVILQWLFAREMARRLGFTPDDLFFSVHASGRAQNGPVSLDYGGPIVSLVIRAQGLEFSWTIGAAVGIKPEDLEELYRRACDEWNARSGEDLDESFFKSEPFQLRWELCARLQAKGFQIPTVLHGA